MAPSSFIGSRSPKGQARQSFHLGDWRAFLLLIENSNKSS
nr:MAG TPA: hypothetical protein [Caudoviricetes sp.]